MKLNGFENIDQVNEAYLDGNWSPFKFNGWECTGDNVTQGPTWVRPASLIHDAYFKKQVVGHTPIEKPPFVYEENGLSIYVVDGEEHKAQYELIC